MTGSSRGLGLVTASLLLDLGAHVVIHGRDPVRLAEAEKQLVAQHGAERLLAVHAELTDFQQLDAASQTIEARFGQLDVLINNAGVSFRGKFGELNPTVIDTVIRANLLAPALATRACWQLLTRSQGRVWFVSSLAAVRGFAGVSIYGAAKAALNVLAESLTLEGLVSKITSGVIYLPFVENDPDKTILSPEGHLVRHHRPADWTQQRAAQAILKAIKKGHPRDYGNLTGRFLAFAQVLWPHGVSQILRQKNVHQVTIKKT